MNFSELLNFTEYSKLLIGLIALADPFGTIPMFLGETTNFSVDEKIKIAGTAAVTFAISLIVFIFAGLLVLNIFGISIASFRVAGGILLLIYGLSMMGLINLPKNETSRKKEKVKTIGIVPLGIPKLAGPGAITTVILYSDIHDEFEHKILVSLVVLTTALIIYAVLFASSKFGEKISASTTTVMNRVMGLLLSAIAIEFIFDGIAGHFPGIDTIHTDF
jgi:multiple antibiotic resistance protein